VTFEEQSIWEQLVDLIGETEARALCKNCGGERVYVPEKPTLGRLGFLTVAARQSLSDFFGGAQLEVPLGPPGTCTKRHQIEALLDTKLSANEIARQVGCTRRWVLAVKANLTDPEQTNLFELL